MSTNDNDKSPKKQREPKPKGAGALMAVGMAFLAIVAFGLYSGRLNINQFQGTRADTLKQIAPRLQFVLRNLTPGLLFLLFSIIYVGIQRGAKGAENPAAGRDHLIQLPKNILQNTIEQLLLSVFAQLILVTYLNPGQVLNVIPVMNGLFFVGRVLFFIGYPNYRGLGFQLSAFPSMAAIGYVGYRYVLNLV
ncbi:uncharacterized protein LOC128952346 [Oppia nitens]|uniref:uncharacterized protein LOC128952346 n=1 Tax=Oppia nitens TaxID=1686743 RepID=UPI0023DBE97F|nr:uncharacterized protein LOC128952346 [Oppia nitens]